MNDKLLAVKDMFYELLQPSPDSEEKSLMANQQMAVQMSKSVQEKGVFIIQNQTQVAQTRIVQIAIRGLQLMDDILLKENRYGDQVEDPIMECAKYCLNLGMTWKKANKIFKEKMVQAAIEKGGNVSKASRMMSLQRTYVARLSSEKKEEDAIYIDSEDENEK